MNAPAAEIIWSWRPEMTPRLRRYVRATVAAAVLAIAVSTAIAVTTPTRFAIVVAFLIASVGVLWWIEHRRFTSTEVHVDAAGVLRVGDRRSSAEIDLADVDTVDVRLRTQPGISTFASPPRWTIEISGPTGAISHPIAHAAGLFNPERADVDRLRAELGALVDRSVTPGGADASREEVGGTQSPDGGSETDGGGAFEWRPPISPHAERRRRWFRISYVGAAVAVAILGASSAWGDWVGVVLSVLTVPGLILACCGGLDWALGRSGRHQLRVDERGVLHVHSPGGVRKIDLRGASVDVDRHASHVGTASGTTRATTWVLSVTGANGDSLRQAMPSFGTTTTEEDYLALQRELRRRT